MFSLTNNTLSVLVAKKGAELQSITSNQNHIEYMWSGDPAFWGKKSPVLFPIVGELKDHQFSYNGQKYILSRHGFARDMFFDLTDRTENSITLTVQSTEVTKTVYPFDFAFSIKYTLVENRLTITYLVENTGAGTMYFSVGAHPAFKVPLEDNYNFEDYQLVFEKKETADRWPLSEQGLLEKEPIPFLKDEQVLPLKKRLFDTDAVVLKDLQSTKVTLQRPNSEHRVEVEFEDFDYLGLWETKGGDFLCIEPWCGIADSVDATGNLEQKEGIRTLEPSDTFVASFTIGIF